MINPAQRLWWLQARSDYALFQRLRGSPRAEVCHVLHYLQMASEKIAKAYFWRAGEPPPKSHTGFKGLLRALRDRPPRDLEWITRLFRFERVGDFDKWLKRVLDLARDVETLAPSEAGEGPNPEYPWPHEDPAHYPAGHTFELWEKLVTSGRGRKFLEFIGTAIERFPEYG